MTSSRTRPGRTAKAIAVIALPLVLLAACGTGSAPASPEAQGDEVEMRLIAYKPQDLTVPAGTTVTWTQRDAGFHTVTSGTVARSESGASEVDADGTFDSGRLAKGTEFTFAFEEPGSFEYFCRIHPATMTGRIRVE